MRTILRDFAKGLFLMVLLGPVSGNLYSWSLLPTASKTPHYASPRGIFCDISVLEIIRGQILGGDLKHEGNRERSLNGEKK